jgi:hypothetical protein
MQLTTTTEGKQEGRTGKAFCHISVVAERRPRTMHMLGVSKLDPKFFHGRRAQNAAEDAASPVSRREVAEKLLPH